jgi:hypothetical protein
VTAWTWPLVLALALATYHVWDLRFGSYATGLRVKLATRDEARSVLARNPKAIVLDVRLHGAPSPFARTVRVPYMELESRIDELKRYRGAQVFVLAGNEAQAVSAGALLARREFHSVACLRDALPAAEARASESPADP